MKFIRLIFTFYKSFVLVNLIITLSCLDIAHRWGVSTFTALFWFKIVTLAIIYYFVKDIKKNEFYYYKNLGITKKKLWISTFSFDFILFLVSIYLILRYR